MVSSIAKFSRVSSVLWIRHDVGKRWLEAASLTGFVSIRWKVRQVFVLRGYNNRAGTFIRFIGPT